MYTLEEAVESIGFGKFQIKLLIILGFFNMAEALEMLLLSFLSSVLNCEWNLSQIQIAFITTVVFIGMMIFAPIWGKCGDIFGRHPIILITSFLTCYCGILSSFSPHYEWILILRAVVGAGIVGGAQAFILLVEFVPMRLRARVVLAFQLFWPIGSVLESVLAAFVLPNLGWRWLVAISSLPLGITLIFFKFAPESARFCLANNQHERATKILQQISADNKRSLPNGDLKRVKMVKAGKILDLFNRQTIRTTLQLWLIWFSCAFLYYGIALISTEFLKPGAKTCIKGLVNDYDGSVELSCSCIPTDMGYYVKLILSTLGDVSAIFINGIFIDRIGRKYTLAASFLGSAIFYLLLLLCTNKGVQTFIIFAIRTCTQSSFSAAYIYTGEVYPTLVRALGVGTCSAFARIGAVLTPFVAESLTKQSMLTAMCLYGGFALAASLSAVLLKVETKDKQLQDMQ